MDAEVIGRKTCLGYRGQFEEIWPITATEGGKRDRTMTSQYALRFPKTPLKPFYVTDTIVSRYHFSIKLKQLSHPEDGGSMLFRNYTVQKP
jgi:hypothetical protein